MNKKIELIDESFKSRANIYSNQLNDISDSIKQLSNKFTLETNKINDEIKLINDDIKVVTEATVDSLYDIINRKCRFYLRLKCIPIDERDDFVKLFDRYSACGGNHGLKDRVDACLKLPIKLESDEVINIPVDTNTIVKK